MESLTKLDKAGDVLKTLSIFSDNNLERAQNYSKMFNSWEKVVGKKIAGYSRIKDLDKNSLIIEADHPAIIQLIQLQYSDTLARLNRNYPELKINDMRILLKDPNIVYNKNKLQMKLNEEFNKSDETEKSEVDLSKIDNDKFKDLLLKMKKRSKV